MAQNDSEKYFFPFVAALCATFLLPDHYTKHHLTAYKGLIICYLKMTLLIFFFCQHSTTYPPCMGPSFLLCLGGHCSDAPLPATAIIHYQLQIQFVVLPTSYSYIYNITMSVFLCVSPATATTTATSRSFCSTLCSW